ncbi:hypothetical protein AcW1_005747 [Taiwanofungus camphoratus]|nr:hypothetical protein AcW2_004510 [Antrodia cinnamomea]KAI0934122.1 hypothetical protein AcV5_006073 [Antrodia cinnamomea]KAI0950580.1 hypothetical protein AcV7_008999 [Antrodia cinnamomea]KAI0957317.1 hypothetical protein AcW1_005747 [Antrodia cinnamomea]
MFYQSELKLEYFNCDVKHEPFAFSSTKRIVFCSQKSHNMVHVLKDKALGGIVLFTASVIFVYYTIWAILLPFLDVSNPIHGIFPSRQWAVRIPVFILIMGISAIGVFIGWKVIKDNKKWK